MKSEHRLWYHKCAAVWTEALPLGNGRIGAMAYGDPEADRFALNEDTLWSGYPRFDTPSGAPEALETARALLGRGEYAQAQRAIERDFTGHFTEAYMPLGDLLIARTYRSQPVNARRELDLETGVHRLSFLAGGVAHNVTSYLISGKRQALVIDFTADKPGAVSLKAKFDCKLKHSVFTQNKMLALEM